MIDKVIDPIRKKIDESKDDPAVLCELYLKISELIKTLESIKNYILNRIEAILLENGGYWGECENATYGITDPKPKTGVDENAWKDAVASNGTLAALQDEYDNARKAFLIDKTQAPRPFIKKKKVK